MPPQRRIVQVNAMVDTFDLMIIGAGEAGQAAAFLATQRRARVAIIDRELLGVPAPSGRACRPRPCFTLRRSTLRAETTPGGSLRTSATG